MKKALKAIGETTLFFVIFGVLILIVAVVITYIEMGVAAVFNIEKDTAGWIIFGIVLVGYFISKVRQSMKDE